jgi:hypothetical protein
MSSNRAETDWRVDLVNNLASCAEVLISFQKRAEGFQIAFLAGGECTLEEQCLIAGEATAAIELKLRWG